MPPGEKAYFGPLNLHLPPTGGLLVVRHAAREPVRTIPEAYIANLTPAGREAARAFGARLGQQWSIGEAVASPVSRCMETAQEIVRGAARGLLQPPAVRPLPALHFDQKLTGIAGLAHIFLDDPGFCALVNQPSAPEYALLQSTLLAELPFPSKPGAINLAVTHDVLVTFLQASLLKLTGAAPQDFPGFLEGICLIRDHDEVRLW